VFLNDEEGYLIIAKKRLVMEDQNMSLFCGYCGYCGAEIAWKRTWKSTYKRKRNVHINICQEPSITFFCNRDCKLNWIFKRPDLKLERNSNSNWSKEEAKPIFDMAEVEHKTDDLKKFLKENNLKILRDA
jgi:hypothetical protein